MTEMACHTYSLVPIPLYDTLGTEAISYIIDKGGRTAVALIIVSERSGMKLQLHFLLFWPGIQKTCITQNGLSWVCVGRAYWLACELVCFLMGDFDSVSSFVNYTAAKMPLLYQLPMCHYINTWKRRGLFFCLA